MGGIKVQKKDGSMQDFDRAKVKNGVLASGASEDQAESIASQIETWVPTAASNGVIEGSAIRSKILEMLGAMNPDARATFESYRKA